MKEREMKTTKLRMKKEKVDVYTNRAFAITEDGKCFILITKEEFEWIKDRKNNE